MEPIRRNISVVQLATLLRKLQQLRATPQLQLAVLKLFIGYDVSSMIQPNGTYSCVDFYRIADRLCAKNNAGKLFDLAVNSGMFTAGRNRVNTAEKYNYLWVASPVFFDEKLLEKAIGEARKSNSVQLEPAMLSDEEKDMISLGGLWNVEEETTPNFTPKFGVLNGIINYTGLNNIILSGRGTQGPAAPDEGGGTNSMAKPSAEASADGKRPYVMPSEAVRAQDVDTFIELMRTSPVHNNIFQGLHNRLVNPMRNGIADTKAEHFTEDQAKEVIREMMYASLRPYFISQERFFRYPSLNSRKIWLQNALYSRYGNECLTRAIRTCKARWKRQLQKKAADDSARRMSNRPISDFEWMTGDQRYYLDSIEGEIMIPADAPPRPSAAASWNRFAGGWMECGNG